MSSIKKFLYTIFILGVFIAVSVSALTLVPANNAQFISQSVKTSMIAGQEYQVSVTVKNTGSTTWTKASNYLLGSQNAQDNLTWGIGRVELADADSIAPNQQKTFSFNVKAPSTPSTSGNYNFQWRMVQESVEWFGDYTSNVIVNVIVNVGIESGGGGGGGGTTSPTLSFSASATSITSGQSSTLTWSSSDTTSCAASGAWSGSKSTSGSQSVSPTTASNYTLTCTGSGGSVSKSATVNIKINFTLTNQGDKSVEQGGSVYNRISAALISTSTDSKAGTFSVSGLPTGATHSFSKESCFPDCSTSLKITTATSTPAGSYKITITGSAASMTTSTAFTLKVSSGPECEPSSVSNGTVASYPDCLITCNSDYVLSEDGKSCVAGICSPSSVSRGKVSSYPECKITCDTDYTLSENVCIIEPLVLKTKIKTIQEKIAALSQEIVNLVSVIGVIKANPNNAETPEALEIVSQQISELLVKLGGIQSEIQNLPAQTLLFDYNIRLGDSGEDVKKLQEFLARDETIYPEGLITGYFGSLTQKAIQKFQCKYNIVCSGTASATGYGVVGPKTRNKLNILMGAYPD